MLSEVRVLGVLGSSLPQATLKQQKNTHFGGCAERHKTAMVTDVQAGRGIELRPVEGGHR